MNRRCEPCATGAAECVPGLWIIHHKAANGTSDAERYWAGVLTVLQNIGSPFAAFVCISETPPPNAFPREFCFNPQTSEECFERVFHLQQAKVETHENQRNLVRCNGENTPLVRDRETLNKNLRLCVVVDGDGVCLGHAARHLLRNCERLFVTILWRTERGFERCFTPKILPEWRVWSSPVPKSPAWIVENAVTKRREIWPEAQLEISLGSANYGRFARTRANYCFNAI